MRNNELNQKKMRIFVVIERYTTDKNRYIVM